MNIRRHLLRAALAAAAVAVVLQAVPYGRAHSNPAVSREPAWDSPRTRELFQRACADCHSHQTVWPWYAHLAPASWLVQRDVDEGRDHFNVSARGGDAEGDEAAEAVREGEMPPWFYLPLHPRARLEDGERRELAAGLAATFGRGDDD